MSTGEADNAEPRRPLARARRVADHEPIRATKVEPDPPPSIDLPTPGVVICFRIFCAIVAFGAVVGAACSFLPLSNNFYGYSDTDGHWEFVGFLSLALTIFTLFTVPLLFPRAKPWMWWYGLAIVLIATLSVYLTIFGLVLLVFWIQPRTQRYFGRMLEVQSVEPRRRGRYYDDDDDFEEFDEPNPRSASRRRPSRNQLD